MKFFASLVVAGLSCAALASAEDSPVSYPATRRVDQVDDYHGEKIADPYRWLEEDVRNSPEVADWIAAENKVSRGFLEAIPQPEEFRKRLTELWNYERYSAPWSEGGR